MSTWKVSLEPQSPGSPALIRVEGESDAFTSIRLREFLRSQLDAGHTELLLDLSDLTFIDSAGLRVLIDADRALRENGGRLVLRAPSRPVLRILDIAGLREQFQIAS